MSTNYMEFTHRRNHTLFHSLSAPVCLSVGYNGLRTELDLLWRQQATLSLKRQKKVTCKHDQYTRVKKHASLANGLLLVNSRQLVPHGGG